MWIFTKDGFISVVQHNSIEDAMLVRARVEGDLAAMFPSLADNIETDDRADYKYRLVVDRDMLKDYLDDAVDDLDYESHAKEAMTNGGRDSHRYEALLDVWQAMYSLQTGRRSRRDGDRSARRPLRLLSSCHTPSVL